MVDVTILYISLLIYQEFLKKFNIFLNFNLNKKINQSTRLKLIKNLNENWDQKQENKNFEEEKLKKSLKIKQNVYFFKV